MFTVGDYVAAIALPLNGNDAVEVKGIVTAIGDGEAIIIADANGDEFFADRRYVTNLRTADVRAAEEAAYLEKDVRYIERLFQTAANNGINETRALETAHKKLGTTRYTAAFAAWEDKYL